MFFKILKKTCCLFLLPLLIIPISAFAYSEYIIPGGENIGIELKAKGIMVVGVYKVNNTYPATDAGLQIGDTITSIEDKEVASIDEMVAKINEHSATGTIKIGYMRNNIESYANLKLYKDESNVYKTGLYVKDRISGIGTLTFIDPNTKLFGALGHEIVERTSGKLLDIKDGKIYSSTVTGIEPSSNGVPGEKSAKFDSQVEGNIQENTQHGIFGEFIDSLPNKKLYKVAQPTDIKKGKATILTVLEDKTIQEYEITITAITKNQSTKNLLFEVTDANLLAKTGGIVQGMSGSPIIQGDYIIGAVTHVVVSNPKQGYGIFITNMLEEAEN